MPSPWQSAVGPTGLFGGSGGASYPDGGTGQGEAWWRGKFCSRSDSSGSAGLNGTGGGGGGGGAVEVILKVINQVEMVVLAYALFVIWQHNTPVRFTLDGFYNMCIHTERDDCHRKTCVHRFILLVDELGNPCYFCCDQCSILTSLEGV